MMNRQNKHVQFVCLLFAGVYIAFVCITLFSFSEDVGKRHMLKTSFSYSLHPQVSETDEKGSAHIHIKKITTLVNQRPRSERSQNLEETTVSFSRDRSKNDKENINRDNLLSDVRTTNDNSSDIRTSFRNKVLDNLGILSYRDATGWTKLVCNTSVPYRLVQLSSKYGILSLYIYNDRMEDQSLTSLILETHEIPEKEQVESFLDVSRHLPLIDVGANLGTVALQAAKQGRQVVALEPIYSNAQRLCRAALDFGLDLDLHVLMNAAWSREGEVTMAADYFREMARYSVMGGVAGRMPGYDPVSVYAILLDTVIDLLPFRQAALKIDVEAHEGHVLAGAERLFQQLYIPLVWLEWEHVKRLAHFGANFTIHFLRTRNMAPYDVISLERLWESHAQEWPATVLWVHTSFPIEKV